MKLALAQLNPIVGDIAGNIALVADAVHDAGRQGADLVIVPELVVSGYPPKDLLLREGFVDTCDRAVDELAAQLDAEMSVIVGHPTARNVREGRIANCASLLHGGAIVAAAHKHLLPNYDVFDERRYFRRSDSVTPIEFGGRKLGVHICEDAWWGDESTVYHRERERFFDPVRRLAEAGADVLINLSASPFEADKRERRIGIMRRHAVAHSIPALMVNQVGGNDDLVFDGGSFVLNHAGEPVVCAASCEPDIQVVDLDGPLTAIPFDSQPREQQLLDALILGLRDYMRKCGFRECVLGLSGGIDSALASYIAAQAVGPQNVHALLMPSRYSSEHSVADAEQLAKTLGINYEVISIDDVHRAYESTGVIGDDLRSQPQGLAEQNLQARIRGAMVMLRSNRHGWLALATGNKSELAVGYCTLYGDMCGGFAVLCDLLKRDVYGISRFINDSREQREVIPNHILDKPPSAELAPDQVDQDTLPPYPVLDAILEGLIEREASVASLAELYPEETVLWVAQRVDRNEFKRLQLPPGIKLSQRAFGSGRRMPIAARYSGYRNGED